MNKRYIVNNKEQGFALVVSLLLLVITTLMASLLVINAANQSKVTKDSTDKFQTFLSAETGIEDALNYIKQKLQQVVIQLMEVLLLTKFARLQ